MHVKIQKIGSTEVICAITLFNQAVSLTKVISKKPILDLQSQIFDHGQHGLVTRSSHSFTLDDDPNNICLNERRPFS